MSKKICFLFPNSEYCLDGIRSALGLAVENMFAYGVVMYNELKELYDSRPNEEDPREYHMENMEWLREMEGDILSIPEGNVEKHGMTKTSLEEVGKMLRDMDVIVPYGIMRSSKR
ncbi:MAG: hypothetical protein ACLFV2_02470 [Desulfurivibrionaceae bacterium]